VEKVIKAGTALFRHGASIARTVCLETLDHPCREVAGVEEHHSVDLPPNCEPGVMRQFHNLWNTEQVWQGMCL
jgi:hypothetical protein